jgi:hypothetical protein
MVCDHPFGLPGSWVACLNYPGVPPWDQSAGFYSIPSLIGTLISSQSWQTLARAPACKTSIREGEGGVSNPQLALTLQPGHHHPAAPTAPPATLQQRC